MPMTGVWEGDRGLSGSERAHPQRRPGQWSEKPDGHRTAALPRGVMLSAPQTSLFPLLLFLDEVVH